MALGISGFTYFVVVVAVVVVFVVVVVVVVVVFISRYASLDGPIFRQSAVPGGEVNAKRAHAAMMVVRRVKFVFEI